MPHDECPMAVAVKENRTVRGLEAIVRRPDGSHLLFAPFPTPLHDEKGDLVGAVNVLIDITGRKAAEDDLTAQKAELERRVGEYTAQLVHAQKMEVLGQITSGMAHDFNNVLQGVGSCLAALEAHIVDEKGRELLASARKGIERGGWLTQHLLGFARHQEVSGKPTDIAAVVAGMRPILERSMGGLIRVELRVENDIWPALVDPNQFELAIINLAINARDAMPLGGRIIVSATNCRIEPGTPSPDLPADLAPGEYLMVSVADTGTGMDADTLARVCEPFFTTKESGKGTGLGLSMVHGMTTQFGGTMHFDSQPGRGTTVTMYLPRAMPEPQEVASPPDTAVHRGDGSVVLLVDDDLLVREGAAAVLESFGYNVVDVESGAEALDIVRGGAPIDVLVTDYAMPDMSGAALVQEVHRLIPELPVLMMTGHAERPEEIPDTAFIQKPFQAERFVAQLASMRESWNGVKATV